MRCSLRALGLALVVSAALASCGDEQKGGQEGGSAPVAGGSDPEAVVDKYSLHWPAATHAPCVGCSRLSGGAH